MCAAICFFSESSTESSCHRNSPSPPTLAAMNRKTDPSSTIHPPFSHRVASDSCFPQLSQSSLSPIPLRFFRRKLSDSQLLTENGVRLVENMSQRSRTGSPLLAHWHISQPMAANDNQDSDDCILASSDSVFSEEHCDKVSKKGLRRQSSSILPVVEIPSLSLKNHPTLMGLFLTEAAEQEGDKVKQKQADTHSALGTQNT